MTDGMTPEQETLLLLEAGTSNCHHCYRYCAGTGDPSDDRPHHDTAPGTPGASWSDLRCPACAEAERLAEVLDEEALITRPERLPAPDTASQTYARAAQIIRGDE